MAHKSNTTFIFAAVLLAATVAFGDQPHCKAEAEECAEKIRQILASKHYLGVTLEDTRWGTVIREVTPDSPAARAGLLPDDRIIFINNHDCTGSSPQEIKQILMPGGKAEQIELTIVVSRFGQIRRLKAQLGLMPEEKIEKIVQRHLETAHRQGSDE